MDTADEPCLDDVKHLVEYALDRSIRIIPEFDIPGHSYSWGLGMPNLTVCNNVQPNWQDYCAEVGGHHLFYIVSFYLFRDYFKFHCSLHAVS